MVRSANAELPPASYANNNQWPAQTAGLSSEEAAGKMGNHAGRPQHGTEMANEGGGKRETPETDAWDFNEGGFPDPAAPAPQAQARPETDSFSTAENAPQSPNRGPLVHR